MIDTNGKEALTEEHTKTIEKLNQELDAINAELEKNSELVEELRDLGNKRLECWKERIAAEAAYNKKIRDIAKTLAPEKENDYYFQEALCSRLREVILPDYLPFVSADAVVLQQVVKFEQTHPKFMRMLGKKESIEMRIEEEGFAIADINNRGEIEKLISAYQAKGMQGI